jgi:uncharacterized protein (TIGR03000 family)
VTSVRVAVQGGTAASAASASVSSYAQGGNAAARRSARVRLVVPAEAEVWFADHKTSQTGSVREYASPLLAAGREYTYTVRVRWTEDGTARVRTRTIRVRPGNTTRVDFTRAERARLPRGRTPAGSPALSARPGR